MTWPDTMWTDHHGCGVVTGIVCSSNPDHDTATIRSTNPNYGRDDHRSTQPRYDIPTTHQQQLVDDAIAAGKIPSTDREYWLRSLAAYPSNAAALAAIEPDRQTRTTITATRHIRATITGPTRQH